jgi:hypothetical protein
MWSFLGMGYSIKNHVGNLSPYLQVENIDPKWLKAVGSPVPKTTRITPLGAWREHNALGKPEGTTPASNTGPVAERADRAEEEFPGQSTMAD